MAFRNAAPRRSRLRSALRPALLSAVTIGALLSAGLAGVAAPAVAAPTGPVTVPVSGTLVILSPDSLQGTPADETVLVTDDGSALAVDPGGLAHAVSGAAFNGTVSVPAAALDTLSSGLSAKLGDASRLQKGSTADALVRSLAGDGTSVDIVSGVATAPKASLAATSAHTVDVAIPTVAGATADATTTLAAAQGAAAFWQNQGRGVFSSFTANAAVQTYTSTAGCSFADQQNLLNLANEAAAHFGHGGTNPADYYTAAPGKHLVIVMPEACGNTNGGELGIGIVGASASAGGVLWTNSATAQGYNDQFTIAHELGHNLSLGHSDGMSCTSVANLADLTAAGCSLAQYADVHDIMGNYGLAGCGLPTLSAAQQIRLGVRDASGYTTSDAQGTQQYTIGAISGGAPGVVALPNVNGRALIVSYRAAVGDDATACWNTDQSAAATGHTAFAAGVQVQFPYALSTQPSSYDMVAYATAPSDPYNSDFQAGQTLNLGSTTVTVSALTADAATVTVTRAPHTPGSVTVKGGHETGKTVRAKTSGWPTGSTLQYRWYRGGKLVAGAHKATRELGRKDLGTRVSVRVTAVQTGYTSVSTTSAKTKAVTKGHLQKGSVVIAGVHTAGKTVKATLKKGWNSHASFTYRWKVGSTVVHTGKKLKLAAARSGDRLRVVVTATKKGFLPTTVSSKAVRIR